MKAERSCAPVNRSLPHQGAKRKTTWNRVAREMPEGNHTHIFRHCSKLTDEVHDEIVVAAVSDQSEAKQSGRSKQTKQIASAASPSRNFIDGRTRVVVSQLATVSIFPVSFQGSRKSCLLLATLLMGALNWITHAQPPEVGKYPEYQVKAEMLVRFAEFVEWPSELFLTPATPFILGIAGRNPFGSYLSEVVTSKSIKGHPIQVRLFPPTGPFNGCHALFIPKEELKSLDAILAQVQGLPMLLIGDSEKFGRRGTQIAFQIEQGRVCFGINLPAARRNKLFIASGLLRLAVKIFAENE